jgi:uncharacterized tellurite resistance protein B-like protein
MGLFDMFKGKEIVMNPYLALCSSLLYMMSADGEVAAEEIGQLIGVLGDSQEARDTLKDASEYCKKTNVEQFLQEVPSMLSDVQKTSILLNVLDSLLADGDASPEEQELFFKFQEAFGFSEEDFKPFFEAIATKNDHSIFFK